MKNSKKVTATPVATPSYETIINILSPTVENNDPFEMELFQDIHAKTGFAYENLEQDPKKLVFEFKSADQILFITFKFKANKLVATWKFQELASSNEALNLEAYNALVASGHNIVEGKDYNPELDYTAEFKGDFVKSHEPKKVAKSKAKSVKAAEMPVIEEVAEVVVESLPTIEELEERINDLPTAKKGRGYANAGKKYGHSGVRIEEFKLGNAKIKKGDKLYFKVGKLEVAGVFSHLNKCVHCPEGYAVIRFEGKNMERRQSRVSATPTAE